MTDVLDEAEFTAYAASQAVLAAEQAVIGGAIQSRAMAELAGEFVSATDFYRPAHQLIFEAVSALIDDGHEVDPTAVLGELTRRGTVQQAGAGPYLMTLMEHAAGGSSIGYHAVKVRDDAVRRRVNEVGALIAQVTAKDDFDLDHHVDLIRQRLDAATARVTGERLPTIGEIVLRRLDQLEKGEPPESVELPYIDLQAMLGGLRPGQFVVIAARPKVGKSTIALDAVRHAAIKCGVPTLMFSLEMTEEEIADRVLAAEARVPLYSIRKDELSDDDWERIARRQDSIQSAPLVVDDAAHCTLGRIRARLRGMSRTGPARLVIVDYLQLMDAPTAESKNYQVAEISRGLKLMAKEFAVPIVALSQLNRESTKSHDKRPQSWQIRDSGAVEQDADIVILLHRDDAHEKESPRAGEMDLIVDLHRNGPTGTVTVAFQGHYARAVDMAADPSWSATRGLS